MIAQDANYTVKFKATVSLHSKQLTLNIKHPIQNAVLAVHGITVKLRGCIYPEIKIRIKQIKYTETVFPNRNCFEHCIFDLLYAEIGVAQNRR